MSILNKLADRKLIHPPSWLPTNVHYLTLMGSVAYGTTSDTSDNDVYGFVIPPKDMIFPHLRGEILDFGTQKKRFSQWQQHHIKSDKKSYDFQVFSIVRYFHLCMGNNPNMIDSLFTPVNCVLHSTAIGEMVRENRKMFLHKGCWHTFKGYAYSQLHKMTIKDPTGKRRELIDKHGYDTKYAYHLVRLLNEVEQILTEGDLDLKRNREQLKSIRRGEWKENDVREYFTRKESELETVYTHSLLPWGPDEDAIKTLLLNCLEHHYGSMGDALIIGNESQIAIREIADICHRLLATG